MVSLITKQKKSMVSLGLSSFRSVLILLLLFIFFDLTVAQPTYLSHFCLGDRYTTNSIFESNLDSLLSSLSTTEGISKGSKGLSQDGVYVLLQCSGYVSSDICQKCMGSAIRDILKYCPNRKESIIWYNECMLRYSDQSFFSIMQANPGGSNTSKIGDASDTFRFNTVLLQLMYGLVTEAAYGSSNTKLFATSKINFMSSQYIYGMTQCTVDISVSDCTICLKGAITDISGSRQGRVVFRPSCFLRYETYPFYEIGATPQPTGPKNGNKNTTRIIIIVIPSVAAAAMFAFAFFTFLLRRKAMSWRKLLGKISKHQWFHWKNAQGKSVEVPNSADVPAVDFETILAATDNFSNSNKLGQGGFGPVYKGKFQGGQELAVKRLSRSSGQGLDEFKNEVLLIAKLQHRNLVRLLGFCIKGDEKMLLYEYMPNKSLDSFIFDQTLCLLLNWEKRYNIIMGIARGILYLHQDSRLRIIHRDLKTSNILLDEDMNPKISDFGMARIFGGTQTQGNTNRVVGTYGYMSPEYALDGLFSVKSDVYSFGIVLLEILSGKKNTSFYESEDNFSLIRYAWRLWDENTALDFIDSSFREAYDTGEVLKCIHVGLLCVQEDPKDRPTMSTVLFMLGGETTSPPTPKQPALVFRRTQPCKTETCSRNEMTISDVKGR